MSWPTVAIGEVVSFLGGGTPSKDNPAYWDGNIPWATVKDIKGPSLDRTIDSITEEGLKNSASRIVPIGTVILPTRMALGKATINTLPVAINQDLKAAIPKASLHPRFLLHFFQSISSEIQKLGAGATVQGVTLDKLMRLKIPLPPREEQVRIAVMLDKAEALRRHRQESILVLEQFLLSIFIALFGEPVRNSKHLPTRELQELAKLERGKFTPRPRNDPSYYGGQYPFIQTGDITRSGGRITSWTQTLNEKGAAVSKEFDTGTVVIAIVGATLGETAIVETPVYCPDSIIGITPYKDRATPEFIEFLLRLWKPRLKELAPDAARANLNLERLRPILALAPPIEEQQEFSRIAKMLRSLVLAKRESEIQLSRMFSSVQQRAFRGELDLSRLVLNSSDDLPLAAAAEPPTIKVTKSESTILFPQAPKAVLAALKELDDTVSKGESIPWSADYFKYRILGMQAIPFSFGEIMQKAESVFDQPPYEEIKDIILDLLGKGGGATILTQSFDLHIDEQTNEPSGRKEIVFGPTA